jgi:hypothetical protein
MIQIDVPTQDEFRALAAVRTSSCVSLYAPISPLPQDASANRLMFKNLAKAALAQLTEAEFRKLVITRLAEQLAPVLGAKNGGTEEEHSPPWQSGANNDEIWRAPANGLGILANPDALRTFRLPHRPRPLAEVADRFHLTPLIRAMVQPQEILVLALSIESVRLLQIVVNLPVQRISIPDLPKDAEDATKRPSVTGRSPHGRIQGSEGEKVLLGIYALKVDKALHPILEGRNTPMALAAAEPLASIFRKANSYRALLDEGIPGSPNSRSDAQLRDAALPFLDRLYAKEIQTTLSLFDALKPRRATTDVSYAAHAATFDAIDRLVVDLDAVVPGLVSEVDGSVIYASSDNPETYSVIDEVARRALAHGARVFGANRDELPGRAPLVAILRFPF